MAVVAVLLADTNMSDMPDQKAQFIISDLDQMISERSKYNNVYSDCYKVTYPLRGSGFISPIDLNESRALDADIFDTTAVDSVRLLASTIMTGMTPAQAIWINYFVHGLEDDREAQMWLEKAAQLQWIHTHASNFDSINYECIVDIICSGMFAMFVEDTGNGELHFSEWAIASTYFRSSKYNGPVDIVRRVFEMTAEQAVNAYPNISEQTRRLAMSKPQEKIELIYSIEPRSVKMDADTNLAINLPIASYIIERKTKKVIEESGFHEMPVMIPRWMLINPCTSLGIGPVKDALPAIRTLNKLVEFELANCDIAVAGMWLAIDDGVLNPRTIKIGPRKVIAANSPDSLTPLKAAADFNITFSKAQDLQGQIRKTLMADQLVPREGPAMTATEVIERIKIIRQLLGPVYGRMQAEYLAPLVTRVFGIMRRANKFGEIPASLSGKDIQIKYVSPLARAQKMDEVAAIERLAQNVMTMAQVDPSALDIFNSDEAIRQAAYALNAPAGVLNSKEDVQHTREVRAEQQKQQLAHQQGIEQAQAAAQLGKIQTPQSAQQGVEAGAPIQGM